MHFVQITPEVSRARTGLIAPRFGLGTVHWVSPYAVVQRKRD